VYADRFSDFSSELVEDDEGFFVVKEAPVVVLWPDSVIFPCVEFPESCFAGVRNAVEVKVLLFLIEIELKVAEMCWNCLKGAVGFEKFVGFS